MLINIRKAKKMFIHIYLLLVIYVCGSYGIYQTNDQEYYKMPPLFAMDDYHKCLMKPGDTYCLAVYDLHSKEHSDLMNYIHEFSDYTTKHFNHTHIYRATCVTPTCRNYIINGTYATTLGLKPVLEGCVNETIWNNYGIEAKLAKIDYCKEYDEKTILDFSDYAIAVVYAVFVICNIIGSFYDVIFCNKDDKKGNSYLLAFSLKRNWGKLVTTDGVGLDPRLRRLKLFNGIRAMTMVYVLYAHTAFLSSTSYLENPQYVEKAYEDVLMQLLFNGTLVMHTFFIMSSFLLAYNLQIHAEKHKITWVMIPKAFFLRWIRLTIPYALILLTVCTWMRHMGSGPLWNMMVTSESNVCREYWWSNIFYFNNYMNKYHSCFFVSWYLAADIQLFCVALILLVVVQKPRSRNVALILLFITSLVITAATTYFQNLDAVVIQSPEAVRNLFSNSDTDNLMYVRGHTNLSPYVLGLAAGLLCYKWQTNKKDVSQFKRYRWIVWLLFPAAVAVILSGAIFYIDDYIPSIFVTIAYATLYKPLFQMIVTVGIISTIFKFENIFRGMMEWRGFTWAGRVTYSAYLLHTMFLRIYVGSLSTTLFMSDYFLLIVLCATTMLSYICGAALWLCVEAPVAGLTQALFTPRSKDFERETV